MGRNRRDFDDAHAVARSEKYQDYASGVEYDVAKGNAMLDARNAPAEKFDMGDNPEGYLSWADMGGHVIDKEHAKTTDISKPITVAHVGENWGIIDGHHRIYNAVTSGRVDELTARHLTEDETKKIAKRVY